MIVIKLVGVGIKLGNLYYLQSARDTEKAHSTVTNNLTMEMIWHRRYGHLGEQNMKVLANNNLVQDFSFDPKKKIFFCEPCAFGKNKRSKFPSDTKNTTTEILELVHTDICGKLNVE